MSDKESFFEWAERVVEEEERMSDNYKVERRHGEEECGGPTKCHYCAIRFAKIFKASVGIVVAKDIKPRDTLVIGIGRRLTDQEGYEANRRLGELIGCNVVIVPECDTMVTLHPEDEDGTH